MHSVISHSFTSTATILFILDRNRQVDRSTQSVSDMAGFKMSAMDFPSFLLSPDDCGFFSGRLSSPVDESAVPGSVPRGVSRGRVYTTD